MDPLVGNPEQTNFSMVADDGQSTTIAYDEPSNTSASVAEQPQPSRSSSRSEIAGRGGARYYVERLKRRVDSPTLPSSEHLGGEKMRNRADCPGLQKAMAQDGTRLEPCAPGDPARSAGTSTHSTFAHGRLKHGRPSEGSGVHQQISRVQ